MNKIRIAQQPDWDSFFTLVAAEGWRVPAVEHQLFAGPWFDCARVLEEGKLFCGLVTSVAHQHSGWIGNLIVPESLRGRGRGSLLFNAALSALQARGLKTVWLTASEAGRPIYEKNGFCCVDEIERWVSCKRVQSAPDHRLVTDGGQLLHDLDQSVWGEERAVLLQTLVAQGQAFACDGAAALLQRGPGLQVIGPWHSATGCPRANRLVLQKILTATDPQVEIVADVLASSPAGQLLAAAGFACAGKTLLMVLGDAGYVQRERMVSLASLGSIG